MSNVTMRDPARRRSARPSLAWACSQLRVSQREMRVITRHQRDSVTRHAKNGKNYFGAAMPAIGIARIGQTCIPSAPLYYSIAHANNLYSNILYTYLLALHPAHALYRTS